MKILGIVNVTPDSFSDGGRLGDAAVAHGLQLVEEGAKMLDIGGESTRPGAAAVSAEEERARVLPVLRQLRDCGVPLSIDTRRASVAAAALDEGVTLVNDVSAGADPAMFPLLARSSCEVVLMHLRGEPATMMAHAVYENVEVEVWKELELRREFAIAAGIAPSRILMDPGIGFAKNADQNLRLLRALAGPCSRHRVLLGASRKSFLGTITGQKEASSRLEGSLAVALWAWHCGVEWLRVHDVAATRRTLDVAAAIEGRSWS